MSLTAEPSSFHDGRIQHLALAVQTGGQVEHAAVRQVECFAYDRIGVGLASGHQANGHDQSDNLKYLLPHLYDIQVADALVVDDTTDGLGKHVGYRQLLNLSAALCVGDRVCEDNLLESRLLHTVAGRTTHYTV